MHEGRIHEIGPPGKVFASPKTPERRDFLGVNQSGLTQEGQGSTDNSHSV